MRIAITGASGFVGRAVADALGRRGDEVLRLRHGHDWQWTRKMEGEAGITAADDADDADGGGAGGDEALDRLCEQLSGCDGLVHLAGASIAARWTAGRRRMIVGSRVRGTRMMARAVAALPEKHRPRVMVCGSAIGYYGLGDAQAFTEASPPGDTFLADVTRRWESAAEPAREAGVRVVHLRMGVVLDPSGGALAKMLPVFRIGCGGKLGDGRQVWSWISLKDAAAAVLWALDHDDMRGPVNGVAPEPVSNEQFTRALGRALRRPVFFRVPATVLRLMLGDMADEMLLGSVRVVPAALQASGFTFEDATLEPALKRMFSR